MIIKSICATTINKIQIRPGSKDYHDIDPRDPVTAVQLKALKDAKVINFHEILSDDVDGDFKKKIGVQDVRKTDKPVDKTRPAENSNRSRRRISKQK